SGQLENLLTASADDVTFIAEDGPPSFEDEWGFEEDFPYEMEELAPGFDLVSGWGRLNGAQAILALNDKWNLADRISGASRYDTAVEVSKKGWSTSKKVVLATGGDFPDALD